MLIRITCRRCKGDPVNSDDSLCSQCGGACVEEVDEKDVTRADYVIDDWDRAYMAERYFKNDAGAKP